MNRESCTIHVLFFQYDTLHHHNNAITHWGPHVVIKASAKAGFSTAPCPLRQGGLKWSGLLQFKPKKLCWHISFVYCSSIYIWLRFTVGTALIFLMLNWLKCVNIAQTKRGVWPVWPTYDQSDRNKGSTQTHGYQIVFSFKANLSSIWLSFCTHDITKSKRRGKKSQRKSMEKFKKNSSCRWGGCHAICVPVQMKNLDSPTLNSTLFKDIDTCRAAVREQRETEEERIMD